MLKGENVKRSGHFIQVGEKELYLPYILRITFGYMNICRKKMKFQYIPVFLSFLGCYVYLSIGIEALFFFCFPITFENSKIKISWGA